MLNILTHSTNPATKEYWKYVIGRYLLRRKRGPDSVRESLLRGLQSLNIPYRLDPKHPEGTTIVLSGTTVLGDAVAAKKRGEITKLIVGPNTVIHPTDLNGVICDPAIDILVVPSTWSADFWIREAPQIAEKIHVWPAGVAIASASSRDGIPILYNKMKDDSLVKTVSRVMSDKVATFNYGNFSHESYLQALRRAPYMVYLATSESQGLALQEAWAHDVPTFVNKSTTWSHGPYTFTADRINAPYLSDASGDIFSNEHELASLISKAHTYSPKAYCDATLSDERSTEALMNILKS